MLDFADRKESESENQEQKSVLTCLHIAKNLVPNTRTRLFKKSRCTPKSLRVSLTMNQRQKDSMPCNTANIFRAALLQAYCRLNWCA